MNALAALRSALRALAANTLRSILTMLGIIIGVAAVITMIAVGQGATQRVKEQMKGLGSNIMLVFPGTITQGGARLGAQTGQSLTEEDALAIARKSGLTVEQFHSVIGSGRMRSPFYDTFMQWTLAGDENAHRFTIANAHKDMRYLAAMANEARVLARQADSASRETGLLKTTSAAPFSSICGTKKLMAAMPNTKPALSAIQSTITAIIWSSSRSRMPLNNAGSPEAPEERLASNDS